VLGLCLYIVFDFLSTLAIRFALLIIPIYNLTALTFNKKILLRK
jgi:hypothetical protein